MMDVATIRQSFPILFQEINDEPLVYLDSAATTQRPLAVLDILRHYYETDNANIHCGAHTLVERTTKDYEASREKVRQFIHAREAAEVLSTRGTTTSLDWTTKSYGDLAVTAGDEIVVSYMEHHSNIIPWQQSAQRIGAILKYIDITEDGSLDMASAHQQVIEKTEVISIARISNVLGVINPIEELTQLAHQNGAVMMVGGTQAVPHMPVDIQTIDADFYALSSHKMCGPTGIGALYGKRHLLERMGPVKFGDEMIGFVHLQESTWRELPWKFETGTPSIAGAIALGAAIDYLTEIGLGAIHQHGAVLIHYVLPKLQAVEDLTICGPQDPEDHTSVIAFNIEGLHPHGVVMALDMEGVTVRAGHHCAQPLLNYLNASVTARTSFYLYNTKEDADRLVEAIKATKGFFQHGTF